MATLLVPTDFSVNSKGGIRFALQLQAQARYDLVFYHSLPLLKPTRWSDARYNQYVQSEKENAARQLYRFVKEVHQRAGLQRRKFSCIVEQSPDAQTAIVNYAVAIKADAICMSTRGAGRLKKLIGTHTSGIIHTSPVPAFIVPKNYRRHLITKILYSSDLNQVAAELKRVRSIAARLNASVAVYHYDYLAEVEEARKKFERIASRYQYPDVTFSFQKYNVGKSLAQHLVRDIRATKSSMAVLFTEQARGWFDKVFLSSKSVDVALDSKIPLLVIPKG